MHLHILGCLDDKLHSGLRELLGEAHATVEIYHLALRGAVGHGGFQALGGRDAERRRIRIARKLDVAAILHLEGAQGYDGQRILHLAVVEGIATGEPQVVDGVVGHQKVASAHQIYIVGVLGIERAEYVCLLVYADVKPHVEALDVGALHHIGRSVGEIGELHQLVELVVGYQIRLSEHVRHVC